MVYWSNYVLQHTFAKADQFSPCRCYAENKKPFDEVIRTAEGLAYVRRGNPTLRNYEKTGQKQVAL